LNRNEFRLRPVDALKFRGWYAVAGEGPPVVLLATPLARARAYRATVEELARWHRVYALEMPGSGQAARLRTPWTLEDYAAWAAVALESLGVEDATVIGHSHTAAVVTTLAALYPARVGRVVVADGAGACRRPLWRVLLGRVADTLTVEYWLTVREWHTLAYNLALHRRNFFRQVRASLASDVTAYAARVAVPALVAWGARDHTLPRRCAELYAKYLPRAEVYVSPGGSHCWPVTHAAEFARVVAEFVRRTVEQRRREVARAAVTEAARHVEIESASRTLNPAARLAVAVD
jgi:pimeloyl-ACP methyl ester carboxylesterase